MAAVVQAARALVRLEGAVEDGQMLGFQSAENDRARLLVVDILDGVELVDVRDDAVDLRRLVADPYDRRTAEVTTSP